MKYFYLFFIVASMMACNTLESNSIAKEPKNEIKDFLLSSIVDSTSFFESIPDYLGINSYKIKTIDSLFVSGTLFYAINIINDSEETNITRALLINKNYDILYDSNFVLDECGVSTYSIKNIQYSKEILYEDLVVIELQESTSVCCGASDKKIISKIYFDSKSTNKLFEYEMSYSNLGNDVCEDTIFKAFERATTVLFLDGDFIQLQTRHSSEGKLDSIKSKNIWFTD